MKRVYCIRTEDFFDALAKGQIPDGSLLRYGTIWCDLALTDQERQNYTFAISPL
jgi:hypothetical protein